MSNSSSRAKFLSPIVATIAVLLTLATVEVSARSCGATRYIGYGPYAHAYGTPRFYPRPMGFAYGQPMRSANPRPYGEATQGEQMGEPQASYTPTTDIVETAQAAGQFETLIAAAKAAGLVDALKGDGPLTVFAPTDEAFAKLPKDKLDGLLQNKAALAEVLTYHVVPARLSAVEIKVLTSARTVQGQSIAIDTTEGVKVNNANVVKPDIQTRNGIIHVIDTVLLPDEPA